MAKKGDLADVLAGFTAGGRIGKPAAERVDDASERAAMPVHEVGTRAGKAPGILDPIMALLTPAEKFSFLSGLMDFMGDFLVNMLDQYSFDLGKVENSIANMQSTLLNHVRTIRNQVDIARQQGLFKVQGPPPVAFGGPAGFSSGTIAAATAAIAGTSDEPKKRREATERDVMDIAASIRTLITRQKLTKPVPMQLDASTAEATAEPATEQPQKASLDTKLQQFQKSADEQKQRIDRIASTGKPASPPAPGLTPVAKPAAKPATKPASKPAAKPPGQKGTKPAAKITMPGTSKPAPVKLDKEKDMLPKGFQAELMKNIKGMIKETKGKDDKKEESK